MAPFLCGAATSTTHVLVSNSFISKHSSPFSNPVSSFLKVSDLPPGSQAGHAGARFLPDQETAKKKLESLSFCVRFK